MRKQTKLVAVLSAAALLAVGASMTSFAAEKGWKEENGAWYYYDNNGEPVYDDWKKSGNNWFWLGEDGAMVTDSLIEDGTSYYYVNANGAMVTNSWVAVEPAEDDYEDNAPDHYWYYFGSNGRAYKASNGIVKKTINGKTYAFDENAKMLYGFVDEQGTKLTDEEPFQEAMYYFGSSDDGAMLKNSWLEYTDGSEEEAYEDLDVMWFYFDAAGKKVVPETGKEFKEKTIKGQKYAFDEYGVMRSEFTDIGLASGATATKSENYKYFSDQYTGNMKKNTWFYAIPDEEYATTYGILSDYEDGNARWFYTISSGKIARNEKKKINGKYYAFDEAGRMKTGLVWLEADGKFAGTVDTDETIGDDFKNGSVVAPDVDEDGNSTTKLYYFSNSSDDGAMKTGKNIKIELQDDTYTFGFEKSGRAMNGIKDDKIYRNGLLLTASTDNKYELVTEGTIEVEEEEVPCEYVIGTSGTIVKPGRAVKNADGMYYAVHKKGDIAQFSEDDEYANKKASCYAKYGREGIAITKDGETTGWKCN